MIMTLMIMIIVATAALVKDANNNQTLPTYLGPLQLQIIPNPWFAAKLVLHIPR